ncbi:TIM barrel protein [Szabonella alba]|uniref:TIM barrel protein n=1 Tax=Szabonella alba TaxID=2804194 RepID=A0A8K0V973_9RHOB|nr:TIM barrel protein [Szabonella alba]MBL4916656.1 TIM barrel protein [Szabonella alba]
MKFALNQMTAPYLPLPAFLDLARDLGCAGVELRNDLDGFGRPVFDGQAPGQVQAMLRDRGLRLLGLSQVYPFNCWDAARAAEVATLIGLAQRAGAESISLIPRNDGAPGDLRPALEGCQPLLEKAGMVALVEPLGFARSSLRQKSELVEQIGALGMGAQFRIVHDTFHHHLAGGGPLYATETGLVHVSGVVHPDLPVDGMEDHHRVLVDGRDRLDNAGQIAALIRAGYDGEFSYECFAPGIQALSEPLPALRRSFDHLSRAVAERTG